MAYIRISSVTDTSCKYQIRGLDTNYNNTTRSVFWTLKRGNTTVASDSQYIINGADETSERTFNGLWGDTNYTLYARITNINGGTYPDVYLDASFKTDPTPDIRPDPPTFNIYSIGQTSVTLTFNIPTHAIGVGIYFGLYGGSLNHIIDKETTSHTITGLTPDTRYSVQMDAYNMTKTSSKTSIQSFWTDPVPTLPAPNIITINAPSDTSVYVSSSIVSNVDYYYFEIWNSSKSSRINYDKTSRSYTTFAQLSMGTTYSVRVKVQKSGFDDSGWSGWVDITTPYTIGSWAWESEVSSGVPVMISAAEWKNFLTKINEVEQKVKGSQTTFDRRIYSGDDISATIVNVAVNALNTMLPVGNKIATVSSGQSLSAAFFNGMKEKLNSLI